MLSVQNITWMNLSNTFQSSPHIKLCLLIRNHNLTFPPFLKNLYISTDNCLSYLWLIFLIFFETGLHCVAKVVYSCWSLWYSWLNLLSARITDVKHNSRFSWFLTVSYIGAQNRISTNACEIEEESKHLQTTWKKTLWFLVK
jgi:hypothetical protein